MSDPTYVSREEAERQHEQYERACRVAGEVAFCSDPQPARFGRDTTTIQFRAFLQTDPNVDAAMVPRILGAMSGKWSRQNFPVTDWLNAVSASGVVKADVVFAVRKLMGMED
jgi:hypothetical protein